MNGEIIFFNVKKGFGKLSHNDEEYFFYQKEKVKEGQIVKFKLVKGNLENMHGTKNNIAEIIE